MNYITTTQLRTKSKELVSILREGGSVELIHRSKVIGEIKPVEKQPVIFDAKEFMRLTEELNLPKTTYAERERRYRAHLMKKYGKNLR